MDKFYNGLELWGVNNDRLYGRQNENINTGMQASQQIFDNDQTKKNNDVSREAAKAEILRTIADYTGQIPAEWRNRVNPLYNSGGTIKNPDMDYQELENTYQAILDDDNATPEEKERAL